MYLNHYGGASQLLNTCLNRMDSNMLEFNSFHEIDYLMPLLIDTGKPIPLILSSWLWVFSKHFFCAHKQDAFVNFCLHCSKFHHSPLYGVKALYEFVV